MKIIISQSQKEIHPSFSAVITNNSERYCNERS